MLDFLRSLCYSILDRKHYEAALLAGLAYLLIYVFSMVAAMVLYFIVQLVGFIIACKGD